MEISALRDELERLFELDDLVHLSRNLLGVDPDQLGGADSLRSYVRTLTEHCVAADSVEALCDAVVVTRPQAARTLETLRLWGLRLESELAPETEFGQFLINKKLGQGPQGISYEATRDGIRVRLKVLHRETAKDKSGLQRFLTFTRLVANVDSEGLPPETEVGSIEGRSYIAHRLIEGQSASARLARTGPMPLEEARGYLVNLAVTLDQLHESRLTHGNLKLENIILLPGEERKVSLQDSGYELLRVRRPANGRVELLSLSAPKAVAPEQLRGGLPSVKSDLYAFGAVMYELLTGRPPFEATFPMDAAVQHLTALPPAPSEVAHGVDLSEQVDTLLLSLLSKEESQRPANFTELVELLDALGRVRGEQLSPEELDERIAALLANPLDDEVALALEAAAEDGADADAIGAAFCAAVDDLAASSRSTDAPEVLRLLRRAARVYEGARNAEAAEGIYLRLTELSPHDRVARSGLEASRKAQGKYEEIVEGLLEEADIADSPSERAAVLARIGELYLRDLKDPEQALLAYANAYCEFPAEEMYAEEIESLARSKQAWAEVIGACEEAANSDRSVEEKLPLLLRTGEWCAQRLNRLDLAVPFFSAALTADPANDRALGGLCKAYRKAQQWSELGATLLQRADASASPDQGRGYRTEAAEILAVQLNDTSAARGIYEQIVEEDPSHEKAVDALASLYEKSGEAAAMARLLERRAEASAGESRCQLLCRVAEIFEDQLNDTSRAVEKYQQVLALDASYLRALKGLERLYGKTAKYHELLHNLHTQIELAATPRQRIALLERVAAIYDEEFYQPESAAAAWEDVLALDETHDNALTQLARFYRVLDRWDDLVDLYERHVGVVMDENRQALLYLAQAKVLAEQLGSPERAIEAYEAVLARNPEQPTALQSLARLRESCGDAEEATAAIEVLARAADPEQAAELYLRAGRILESHGDRTAAILRYKLAFDANPGNKDVTAALRAAYVLRGDANAAVELLQRELETTEGETARSKLGAELARLLLSELKDATRAERVARQALDLDPANTVAQTVLADLYFDSERYREACPFLEQLAKGAAHLGADEAVRVLVRLVDALTLTGSTEAALAPMNLLFELAPNDANALKRVAAVTFEHGDPQRACQLYGSLLSRFDEHLDEEETYTATYRFGEATRRRGNLEEALEILADAADLNPSAAEPHRAIAAIHEQREDWEQLYEAKSRLLDVVDGEERLQLLTECGDLAATKLDDRTRATRCLVAALEERPDDRKLLTRLMQLYSEEKDWSKLVDVVVKLADFVDDYQQRAKYLMSAGIVTARELGDPSQALHFYTQVLDLDPDNEKALTESIRIVMDQGNWDGAETLLKQRLARATANKDQGQLLSTFLALAVLYERNMGNVARAIDAYEAAQVLDPNRTEIADRLARLYSSDRKYLKKAVAAQISAVERDPYRAETYKRLRQLYTEAKHADASWCLCQALAVMNLADADEERFYRRLRSEDPAYAKEVVTDEDWRDSLYHPFADPVLTTLFALIQPAIVASRGETFLSLGYDPAAAFDPAHRQYAMSQTLFYAAGVLDMAPPPCFENPNYAGVVSSLHAEVPSLVFGATAMRADIPPQAAAFAAGRQLALFRPGAYVRHLVTSGTGLKSWLFAAFKLISPQFPVASSLSGHVQNNVRTLDAHLPNSVRDELARVVSKLLQNSGAIDLKKWVRGIDYTADRVGFVLAHDLQSAADVVRATASDTPMPVDERVRELVLYAISEPYFSLRRQLQISVDSE